MRILINMELNDYPLVVTKDESEKDLNFEEFFETIDMVKLEKTNGKFTSVHKERMRQSFIKHNGYPYPTEIWPEKFKPKG